jgi:two-component system sensor histidine kinase ChvG
MIRRLTAAASVRARLFINSGEIVADSRHLGDRSRLVHVLSLPPIEDVTPIEQFAGMIVWLLERMHARTDLETYREVQQQTITDYPETRLALAGEVTGVARHDGSGGYLLSVAMPVQRYRQVIGVIMLSQSGSDIQEAVRDVWLVVLQVFAGAWVFTVLLSLYLAGTIARPVHRLAEAAARVRRGNGVEIVEIPDMTQRGDEIGDLSGALRAMTTALYQRLDAIGRFAADVSHEIKNPLTSLRSAVETASRVDDPEKQKHLMSIILDDVQRLDRLISDISDYSRLDAELNRELRKTVDVKDMLHMLASLHIASNASSSILINAPEDMDLTVPAVESRLGQVFRNLIVNAMSFSPSNGVIRLSAHRKHDSVVISVSDDGPGIPPGKLAAIFDRFYTERPVGEKFGTHSGLGLSISKQIIEAHGGTIRAENKIDGEKGVVGAKFIITLPAH